MEEDLLDCAVSALTMLEVAAMIHEAGRKDILDAVGGCALHCDDEYEFAAIGLDKVGDFYRDYTERDENGEDATMYFSSNDMMEYYRLCREYSSRKGCTLKENPYMRRAKSAVHEHMTDPNCYHCYYLLQTKINHKWASGIVFCFDYGYFGEYTALLSRMLFVFQFYTEELAVLRAELATMEQPTMGVVIPFAATKKPKFKRRAA